MVFLLIFCLLFLVWLMVDFFLGSKFIKKKEPLYYPYRDNTIDLITTGNDFFASLKNDIENATSFIHIQFYIFKNDTIGKELMQLLYKKAEEGVEIKLLLDYIGSRKLSKKTVRELKAQIDFAFMNKPTFPFFFYTLNRRNHRKITVIDGQYAYIGGYNVGDEYLGKSPKLGDWRDYHLRIHGGCVADLHAIFINDWNSATNETLASNVMRDTQQIGATQAQILPTNGKDMQDFFLKQINSATKKIFIGSPYFIPGKEMMLALINAAKRGVDVIILLPFKADHAFVKEAAFPYFPPLLKAGCTIHRFYQGFYHAKVFNVDDNFVDIGTANFDKRSFYLNSEVNCIIRSPEFIQKANIAITRDLARAETLTLNQLQQRSIISKGKELLARTVSGLL